MADLAGPELPRTSAGVAEPTVHDPDVLGHFGSYGGRLVPEALMAVIEEVTAAYEKARGDQAFLDELDRRAARAGLTERITTVNASMSALDYPDAAFDLIWSEGAIYVMGFAEGLRAWKRLLKRGGVIAVTEISWLGSKVPEDTLAKVDTAIADAKTALNGTDITAIKSAMEKLGQESQALGQAIYEATQAEQAASGSDGGSSSSSNDDVVDAEVVDDEDDQEKK